MTTDHEHIRLKERISALEKQVAVSLGEHDTLRLFVAEQALTVKALRDEIDERETSKMTSDINDETPTTAIADRVSRLEERVDGLTEKFPTRSEFNTVRNALSDKIEVLMVNTNKGFDTLYKAIDTRIHALREESMPLIYKAEFERKLSRVLRELTELRAAVAEQIGKLPENPVAGFLGSLSEYLRRGEAEVRKIWDDAVKAAKDKDNAE